MKRTVFIALAFALLRGLPGHAHAQCCSASASPISFGSVSPVGHSAVSAAGTVSVRRTWPANPFTPNVEVCLNLGGTGPRNLVSGANLSQYDLH